MLNSNNIYVFYVNECYPPPKGVKLNENEDTFYYKTHRNRYFCIK